MHDAARAYLAGFLDGDGSIIFQLVRRKDYVYGFQIRASVCFYQSTRHRAGLECLKQQLGCGYIRDRAGSMSDYTIVGWSAVKRVLELVQPFVVFKRAGRSSAGHHVQVRREAHAQGIPRNGAASRCICDPKLFEAKTH